MFKVNQKRIRPLNNKEIKEGPVVYWMNREIRTKDNWSLLYAQQIALENNQSLVVIYNLVPGFLGGQNRQLTFKVDGLKEVEKSLKEKNIPFKILIDENGHDEDKTKSANLILDFCKEHKAGALITDFYPLRITRKWTDEVRKKTDIAFFGVDSHNIVPAWVASEKKEYAAYTFRPKIHKKISEFLEEFPKLQKQKKYFNDKLDKNDWDKILPNKNREELDWIKAGQDAAIKSMNKFIKGKLINYATDRNDPNKDNQSNLSPYLHYGMISAQRIALEVVEWAGKSIEEIIDEKKNKAKVDLDKKPTKESSAGAFLEELIVRKELSDNFCFYEQNYDNCKAFPDWAQKSIKRTYNDKREYVYTKKEFENAETHDELWNAAQLEMVKKGKMHGYMRMYWAKKILEWTNTVQYAQEVAIYLNDKYELDGRDPNGYSGIAWSVGGVHDRPWFDRPVFGQIRYMARSGCEKKFNVDEYIKKWTISD